MRMNSIGLICLIVILYAIPSDAAAQWKSDIDTQDYESDFIAFSLIGTPTNDPVNSTISITSEVDGVKNGQKALEFAYEYNQDASPALLDVKTLLLDLVSISFWVKSDNDANWVVYMLDADGAGFLSILHLNGGEWRHVTLLPGDFVPDLKSDVQKDEVDTSRLDVGLVMLDARNKFGAVGQNTVHIDDLRIAREPLQLHDGDYVVSGGVDTIDSPTILLGNLIVENGARLDITASRFQIQGDIIVRGGSTLNLQDGAWQFLAEYSKQYEINVSEGSDLIFFNGIIRLNQNLLGEVGADSLLRLDTVRNGTASMTFNILETATLELESAQFVGEFVLSENSQSVVSNSDLVVLWIDCKSAFTAPISLPDGELVESWTAPAELGRSVTVENSTDVQWTFIVSPFCEIDLVDSSVRAIGMTYWHPAPVSVSVVGLQSDVLYDNFCLEGTLQTVCLQNSLVESWNIYATGAVIVDVIDSTVGESIAFKDSQINFTNSICDGRGGHIGSQDQASLSFTGGEIQADVRAYGSSQLNLTDSLVTGSVFAADSSQVILDNVTVEGRVLTFGDGTVLQ